MPIGVAGGIALAGTAASAGLSAAGSAGQKSAASSAADAQSQGIQRGIDALGTAYGRAQGYLDPYYGQGQQAQNRLNKNYGFMPPGLTKKQQKAYRKSPGFNKYGKSLAAIDASAPSKALPDTSRFDISGLAGKYDPKGITDAFGGLSSNFGLDAKRVLAKYDVSGLGDRVNVQQDPGYEFRKQQGELAQQRMASKRGTLQGGGFAKDLENYSQGLASQEYGNAYARLLGENETGFGREMSDNKTQYGRELDSYGRLMAGNELGYNRELQGSEIGYGRVMGENEATYGRETNDYARRLQMLGLQYEPAQQMANRGYETAGNLSNLSSNYGGNIANLFAQQGGAQAAGITGRAAANSQMLNQIGQIGGIAALYGGQAFGGGYGGGGSGIGNNYPRYQRGGYNPYSGYGA